ncbi:MAG: hypothetical protein LBI78_02685 [Campylobacteraceae bacterium]|jgi:hypothetical protein|nr:hypothetical protein [Campylobacteraceae bacterium]
MKTYTQSDVTSKFDTYAVSYLSPQGFNCSKGVSTGGEWYCDKTIDGITYCHFVLNVTCRVYKCENKKLQV